MVDNRPVNLDIRTIRFPVMAVVSILHRVSGVFLIAGFGVFLYLLHFALASPADFAHVVDILTSATCKWLVWAILAALAYHSCAGVRHLVMDLGIGESLKGGQLAASITLVVAALLIVLSGVWVWSW